MEIKEAQKKVDDLIQHYGGYWSQLSMMARITEEVGELARAMNIKHGDKKSKSEKDGREIEKELADIVFTALAISNDNGIDLEKELKEKIEKDYEKCQGVYNKKEEKINCTNKEFEQ